jgi:uncharacterized membrane protein YgcG
MSGPMPLHPADEDRVVADMTRELDGLAMDSSIQPPAGFADRVMAAVAAEPLPQPVRAFGVALLGGRLQAAVASVGDAWRVTVGGSTPLAVRGQALALVLVVAIGSIAIAGGAAVGAIDLLNGTQGPLPSSTTPVPSFPAPSPSPSPSSSIEASPSPDASPTETPEPTETPRSTPRTTPSPTGTDDHGGGGSESGSGSGSGSGGSSGSGNDSGSGGGDKTPTPTAGGTDDHGGSDG